MGKPEAYVEKYLLKRCKALGFGCLKFTSDGTNGVPDRIVIGNGRTVFVETKRPGERLRRLQEVIIAEMRGQGADVRVADTRELVDALLGEIAADTEAADRKGVPDISGLLREQLVRSLPEASPAQIEQLIESTRDIARSMNADPEADIEPDRTAEERSVTDRVLGLADRWESVPALRRGAAARELRAALTGTNGP
ncbi:VRR-NUC domain-containing protein [Arthrobacter koreensis]|uniref:VRR-NUC domain-containing protein n=1 Tax=Arthrobacter koreensis TaxID=199136 RepID=UPI003828E9BF